MFTYYYEPKGLICLLEIVQLEKKYIYFYFGVIVCLSEIQQKRIYINSDVILLFLVIKCDFKS